MNGALKAQPTPAWKRAPLLAIIHMYQYNIYE